MGKTVEKCGNIADALKTQYTLLKGKPVPTVTESDDLFYFLHPPPTLEKIIRICIKYSLIKDQILDTF